MCFITQVPHQWGGKGQDSHWSFTNNKITPSKYKAFLVTDRSVGNKLPPSLLSLKAQLWFSSRCCSLSFFKTFFSLSAVQFGAELVFTSSTLSLTATGYWKQLSISLLLVTHFCVCRCVYEYWFLLPPQDLLWYNIQPPRDWLDLWTKVQTWCNRTAFFFFFTLGQS